MEINHLEPALQQFASHIEAIVLKNAAVRADFEKRIDRKRLSAQKIFRMSASASTTLATDIENGKINWWHALTDYMTKTACILKMPFPELHQTSMEQMIIYSRWSVSRFKNILGLNTDKIIPPAYPAKAEDIKTFPILLSYLEKNLIPVMTRELEVCLDLQHLQMEQRLWTVSGEYARDRAPGFEVFLMEPEAAPPVAEFGPTP